MQPARRTEAVMRNGEGIRLDAHTILPLPGEVFWVEQPGGELFLRSIAESPEITVSYETISPSGKIVQCAHSRQGFISEFFGARFHSLGLMHDGEWEQFAKFVAFLNRERIEPEELFKFSTFAMRMMAAQGIL